MCSDWSTLHQSSCGDIRRLKPSHCGSNVSRRTFGSSADWVMHSIPLPKRPSPMRRTDRSWRPLDSCSKQGRLLELSSWASTQLMSYSSWVACGAPQIRPPAVLRSGAYSTSLPMASSLDRPRSLVTGMLMGEVLIPQPLPMSQGPPHGDRQRDPRLERTLRPCHLDQDRAPDPRTPKNPIHSPLARRKEQCLTTFTSR